MDCNEVISFIKEFKIDSKNRYGELIIDEPTNTFVSIDNCKNIEDVKTYVVFALCRPIGKALDEVDAMRLLKRVNDYYKQNLSRQDMRLMYQKLCYVTKLDEFKSFIQRGFPMAELR